MLIYYIRDPSHLTRSSKFEKHRNLIFNLSNVEG
jgi:hypothetical protein